LEHIQHLPVKSAMLVPLQQAQNLKSICESEGHHSATTTPLEIVDGVIIFVDCGVVSPFTLITAKQDVVTERVDPFSTIFPTGTRKTPIYFDIFTFGFGSGKWFVNFKVKFTAVVLTELFTHPLKLGAVKWFALAQLDPANVTANPGCIPFNSVKNRPGDGKS